MTSEEIIKEINGLSPEDLASRYTKSTLQSFYRVLYDGLEPNKYSSKTDLAYACRSAIEEDKRTKDLCKALVLM